MGGYLVPTYVFYLRRYLFPNRLRMIAGMDPGTSTRPELPGSVPDFFAGSNLYSLVFLFVTLLPLVSLWSFGSSTISNQHVAGSIIVRHIKSILEPSLPLRVYVLLPICAQTGTPHMRTFQPSSPYAYGESPYAYGDQFLMDQRSFLESR